MIPGCHNTKCEFFEKTNYVIKDGYYYRREDSRKIARFRCKKCGRRFSHSTATLEWRQKKRRVNGMLFKLLASGISMRRSALILNIHRTTVRRKFIYLAEKSGQKNVEFLKTLSSQPVRHLQFDDLITSVHTKLKPLSVTLAVDARRRYILGTEVGSLPAFGLLAKLSRKKYGPRKSEHQEKLTELFSRIKCAIDTGALIESDEHQNYQTAVKFHFPDCEYLQYKGGRGAIVGQGELKKLKYDPLFTLNHTCAMLRANINRLIRKTWCTTKDPLMLKRHLEIYTCFHNHYYLN